MIKGNTIPEDRQKIIGEVCLTIVTIVLAIAMIYMSVNETARDNNALRIQVETLQTQIEQSQATLIDVQNTLRIVDEEFGDYVYQFEQERKEMDISE